MASECAYCGGVVGLGETGCHTETCYLVTIVNRDRQLAEARRRIEELEKELALSLLHGKNIVAGLRYMAQNTAVSDGEFRSLLRQRFNNSDNVAKEESDGD